MGIFDITLDSASMFGKGVEAFKHTFGRGVEAFKHYLHLAGGSRCLNIIRLAGGGGSRYFKHYTFGRGVEAFTTFGRGSRRINTWYYNIALYYDI